MRESTAVAGLDWELHYEFVPAPPPAPTSGSGDTAAVAECGGELRSDMAGGGHITMQVHTNSL